MATFSSLLNILPDPNNPIGDGGQASGTDGPGFKSIKFTSTAPLGFQYTLPSAFSAVSPFLSSQSLLVSLSPMTLYLALLLWLVAHLETLFSAKPLNV